MVTEVRTVVLKPDLASLTCRSLPAIPDPPYTDAQAGLIIADVGEAWADCYGALAALRRQYHSPSADALEK